MERAEIEELIHKTESRYLTSCRATYWISWGLAALLLPLMLTDFIIPGIALSLLMAAIGIFAFVDARRVERDLATRYARILWARIHGLAPEVEYPFDNPPHVYSIFASTQQLGKRIEHLYKAEPSGQVFPLSQALLVMDVHKRQQERLQLLQKRLDALAELRHALTERVQALRELNAPHASAETTLQKLHDDEAALRSFLSEIEASCLRLESLVLGVERALQVRTLNLEVTQISEEVWKEWGDEALALPDELGALDAQISREVETYLELERQADAQLQSE